MSLRSPSWLPQAPIRAKGQVLKFSASALEVESSRGCFGLFWKQSTLVIMWETISGIAVETTCFGGEVTVTVLSGQAYVLRASSRNVMRIAAALHRCAGRGAGAAGARGGAGGAGGAPAPGAPLQVRPEVLQQLGHHRGVGLCDEGVLLKSRSGCCRTAIQLVPWSSLVSLSLAPSRKVLVARAALPAALRPKDAARKVERKDSADERLKAEGFAARPAISPIRIRSSREVSELLFHEIARMMAHGRHEDPIGGPIASDLSSRVSLMKAGIFMDRASCFHGGVEKDFLPWESVAWLSWRRGGVFRRRELAIGDLSGHRVPLGAAPASAFDAIRAQLVAIEGAGGRPAPAAARGRRGLSLAPVGADVAAGRRGRTFVPRARLEAMELRFGRCMGGSAWLVLEGGRRMWASSACFSASSLWRSYKQWLDLSYHPASFDTRHVIATFNPYRNQLGTCELTPCCLRVLDGRCLREWDVSRVVGCATSASYNGGNGLILKVETGPQRREVFRIPVRPPADAGALAAAVCQAAVARRQQLRLGPAAAGAPPPAAPRSPAAPSEAREVVTQKGPEAPAARAAPAAPPEPPQATTPPPAPAPAPAPPAPPALAAPPAPAPAPAAVQSPPPPEASAPAPPEVEAEAEAEPERPDALAEAGGAAPAAGAPPDGEPPAASRPWDGDVEEIRVFLDPEHVAAARVSKCGLLTFLRTADLNGKELSALYVQGVLDGPVKKWNERNPGKCVGQGDFIVRVNGRSNDAKAMLEALEARLVELVVRRRWP